MNRIKEYSILLFTVVIPFAFIYYKPEIVYPIIRPLQRGAQFINENIPAFTFLLMALSFVLYIKLKKNEMNEDKKTRYLGYLGLTVLVSFLPVFIGLFIYIFKFLYPTIASPCFEYTLLPSTKTATSLIVIMSLFLSFIPWAYVLHRAAPDKMTRSNVRDTFIWAGIIMLICSSFIFFIMNTYVKVSDKQIIFNEFLNLKEKKYSLSQIDNIKFFKSTTNFLGGSVKKGSKYTIEFNDGYMHDFSTDSAIFDYKISCYKTVAEYISTQSKISIEVYD